MKKASQSESQTYYLNWEVQKAAKKLISEIMLVKPGENVLITCNSGKDNRVINATAAAVMEIGAYPIVMEIPFNFGPRQEPKLPLAAACKATDVWISYDFQTFMSKAWKAAMKSGVRQITATNMDVRMLINVIGLVNHEKVLEFGNHLCELTNSASKMLITSPKGTNISFSCEDRLCHQSGGISKEKGTSIMLLGQSSICPKKETINGTFVFDGGLYPPKEIEIMQSPVKLTIEEGVCTKIEGEGREAYLFKQWMASFNDEKMYWVAHISYGYNPGVLEPTGHIAEDERIFGCMTIGLGKQVSALPGPGWDAPGHTDGIILNPSIYLDGTAIEENGFYVEPGLVKLCEEMNLPGY